MTQFRYTGDALVRTSAPPSASRFLTRSLTGKRWHLAKNEASGDGLVEALALQRGIDLREEPSWEKLTDPHSLGDMGEAVERVHRAVRGGERIGIIGDYDADGITGVAQLTRFFRRRDIEPVVILPHREKDGYGVKRVFMERLRAAGVTLVLTVDTGIAFPAEIAEARRRGIDVIVTDHHIPSDILPQAILVHPTVRGHHANPSASGSGVVFTFIRALEGAPWEGSETDAALAAIGTVADVVPLTGENRRIVRLGLQAMNGGGGGPIFALARSVAGEGEMLTSTHIAYRIAPRINAAGRLADPLLALQALLEGGGAIAELHALNTERQERTEDMLAEALRMLESSDPLLIAVSPSFHPGIIGLIAGKITERFGKPSLVGTECGGIVTCSLRSIPEYDIAAALARQRDHLLTFGGHPAAGGCTMELEEWPSFAQALLDDALEIFGDRIILPTLAIDATLDTAAVTRILAERLQALAPFGEGNREPLVLLRGQSLSSLRNIGTGGKHLQCTVRGIRAVGFGLGYLTQELPLNVDIACRIGINHWQDREHVQLQIEDIAPSAPPPLEEESHTASLSK